MLWISSEIWNHIYIVNMKEYDYEKSPKGGDTMVEKKEELSLERLKVLLDASGLSEKEFLGRVGSVIMSACQDISCTTSCANCTQGCANGVPGK